MEQRDEDLILEFQKGAVEAYEMLFIRYKKPVLNFSLRVLGNLGDAEDVTSEVFVTLYSKKDSYKPKAKFSTWLFTVAHNACISLLRKRNRMVSMWFTDHESGEEKEIELTDTGDSAPQELTRREEGELVRLSIQKLPVMQKEALLLREYQNMSYEEIAKVLNCSLENVKVLIFRARERLRQDLSGALEERHE